MDPTFISWLLNGLFGVVMWLGKAQIDSIKNDLKDVELELEKVKEHYIRKEDFREFKSELWDRLARMETSMEQKIETVTKIFSGRE